MKDYRHLKMDKQLMEKPVKPFQSESFDSGYDPFSTDVLQYAEDSKRNRWSVSWSDLMMTMFVMFVILYVYQAGNRELKFGGGPGITEISDTGGGGVAQINPNIVPSDILDDTRKAIQDEFVDAAAKVDLIQDRAVRISLAGDLFFDVGKADLKMEARWQLKHIAGILKNNAFAINVVGHTDSMPNHSPMYPTNWELSTARACRVARYLIEEEGVDEARFFVSGYSWHKPVAPNTTPYNRRLNRRVEIILMKDIPYQVPEKSLIDQIR